MEITITQELESLCFQIMAKNLSAAQWADLESTDMFQNEVFCGGFNAQENMFCFSYHNEDDIEYWFQLSLYDAIQISKGHEPRIVGWPSE